MIMESRQVSLFSGRFSLIGLNPVLKVSGKDREFELRVLQERGTEYLEQVKPGLEQLTQLDVMEGGLRGKIKAEQKLLEESERPQQRNIAQVLRVLLTSFKNERSSLQGLYGAFSYDMVRLFENLGDSLPDNDVDDFCFFLYDSFVFFDHIKEKTELVVFRKTEEEISKSLVDLELMIQEGMAASPKIEIGERKMAFTAEEFCQLVELAKQDIIQGEYFQIVLSNILRAPYSGDALALYLKYRERNPSPYLFYFDLGDQEFLVGASPEMMVRYEDGVVHLRPIAGTMTRGADAFEDHEQQLKLLNDPKERAELDMLIDLGRNDLRRICLPGIEVSDYRFLEKYARVMHTVAHLKGRLKPGYSGLDALIACSNAGTLTGAPKVAAMKRIDQLEKERRGYYGGSLGQLSFSGDVDTCILIGTAHLKNGEIRYQSGAGVVYDSDPKREYQETLNKAQAFLDILENERT